MGKTQDLVPANENEAREIWKAEYLATLTRLNFILSRILPDHASGHLTKWQSQDRASGYPQAPHVSIPITGEIERNARLRAIKETRVALGKAPRLTKRVREARFVLDAIVELIK